MVANIEITDTGAFLYIGGLWAARVSSVEAWRAGEALEPLGSFGFAVDLDAVFEACADGDTALACVEPPAPTFQQVEDTIALRACIEAGRL